MSPEGTPIGLLLRVWLIAELFFASAATLSIGINPAGTATNFAWHIRPEVMAALIGCFYMALAPTLVLAMLSRRWESVRVMVWPAIIFTFAQLVVTHWHWDRFAVGTQPFIIWYASYVLPPPIFAYCYFRQQQDAVPRRVDPATALPRLARGLLILLGAVLTLEMLVILVYPAWLTQWAPWQTTPLNARAFAGYMLALSTMLLSIALENDRERVRIALPFLVLAGPLALIQIARFPEQVDWRHPRLAILVGLLAVVSALGLLLLKGGRGRGAA